MHVETQQGVDFEIDEWSPVTQHPHPPNEPRNARSTDIYKLARDDSDLTPKCRCSLDESRRIEKELCEKRKIEPQSLSSNESEPFPLTEANLQRFVPSTTVEGPKTMSVGSITRCKPDEPKSKCQTCLNEGRRVKVLGNGIIDDIRSGAHPPTKEIIRNDEAQLPATPTRSEHHEFAARHREPFDMSEPFKLYTKYIFQATEDVSRYTEYRAQHSIRRSISLPDMSSDYGVLSPTQPEVIEVLKKHTLAPTATALKYANTDSFITRKSAVGDDPSNEPAPQDPGNGQGLYQVGSDPGEVCVAIG